MKSTCRHSNITVEPDSIIRMILDSSNLLTKDTKHEENVRNFIFKLQSRRAILLGGSPDTNWQSKFRKLDTSGGCQQAPKKKKWLEEEKKVSEKKCIAET